MPLRQRLEDDGDAGEFVFPDQLAVGVQLDEAVRPLAVLGEQDAVLDGFLRGRRRGDGEQEGEGGQAEGAVHELSLWIVERRRNLRRGAA